METELGKKIEKRYRPSNGTEGCSFMAFYCDRCLREQFTHTQNHIHRKCDILNRSLLYDVTDKLYPDEWTYAEDGSPKCTAWIRHDWEWDENRELIDAKITVEDPNQLKFDYE